MSVQAIPLVYIEKRLGEIEKQIRENDDANTRLHIESETLSQLRNQALDFGATSGDDESTVYDGLGSSDAIRRLVASRPGLTPKQIVDELQDRVDTVSTNRRKMLYSVISGLRRRHHIERRDGRYYIAEKKGYEQITIIPDADRL